MLSIFERNRHCTRLASRFFRLSLSTDKISGTSVAEVVGMQPSPLRCLEGDYREEDLQFRVAHSFSKAGHCLVKLTAHLLHWMCEGIFLHPSHI